MQLIKDHFISERALEKAAVDLVGDGWEGLEGSPELALGDEGGMGSGGVPVVSDLIDGVVGEKGRLGRVPPGAE